MFLNLFLHQKSPDKSQRIRVLFHCWEEQYITDSGCISEEHAETVDTDSQTTCWWHTVFKGFNVVVVDACRFIVTKFFSFAWASKRLSWSIGSFNSVKALPYSLVMMKSSKRSVKRSSSGFFLASGDTATGCP